MRSPPGSPNTRPCSVVTTSARTTRSDAATSSSRDASRGASEVTATGSGRGGGRVVIVAAGEADRGHPRDSDGEDGAGDPPSHPATSRRRHR